MTENNVTTMQPLTVPLKKYLWWFVGISVGMNILIGILGSVIGGSGLGGVSMMVPYLAAMTAVDRFVNDHHRGPNDDEKRALVWWSFGFTILWSLVGGALVLLALRDTSFVHELGVGWIVGIVVVTSLIAFLMIWATYTFWPKRALRNRQRLQERLAAKAAKKAQQD
ncbi:MAG: ABZJ_00895 family protein [Gordonia sp. (in: high G+C Gram-positive bacteria)]|uniref:ABZJ_00895 family protein n=1 Tax=Gordonia sp. (in: high G+C Gram-positive bacteria) TaxID=84139 RepID=UPI0039E4DF94